MTSWVFRIVVGKEPLYFRNFSYIFPATLPFFFTCPHHHAPHRYKTVSIAHLNSQYPEFPKHTTGHNGSTALLALSAKTTKPTHLLHPLLQVIQASRHHRSAATAIPCGSTLGERRWYFPLIKGPHAALRGGETGPDGGPDAGYGELRPFVRPCRSLRTWSAPYGAAVHDRWRHEPSLCRQRLSTRSGGWPSDRVANTASVRL